MSVTLENLNMELCRQKKKEFGEDHIPSEILFRILTININIEIHKSTLNCRHS